MKCKCGCEQIVNPGRKYICGHNRRGKRNARWKPVELKYCLNCEKEIPRRSRSPFAYRGCKFCSPSCAATFRWHRPEYRETQREGHSTKEYRRKHKKSYSSDQRSKAGKESWENSRISRLEKVFETKKKNGTLGQRISIPQRKMFSIVKEHYPDAFLEYSVKTNRGRRFLDIAIPSKKIDFEYDGSWWHRDKNKDTNRDQELLEIGWTTIRFKSLDQVKEYLDNLK